MYYFAAPFHAKSNEILEKQNMLENENPQMKVLLFCVKAIQKCQKSSK